MFYKSRTTLGITWLVSTAESHGSKIYKLNDKVPNGTVPLGATASTYSTSTPPADDSKAKLKGRARTLARRAQKGQASSSVPAQEPSTEGSMREYKVSTQELLRQAEFLNSLGSTIVSKPSIHTTSRSPQIPRASETMGTDIPLGELY
jgi:hypothetical protein